MKVVIVIPTYNEAENISRLLPVLEKEFKTIKHNCHVLIVDGNSPDGTQKIVSDFSANRDWVHLLIETKKEGLGMAYVKGFKKAMHKLRADVVMEMDADFQHDPKDIKRFIEEIENGSDYVLGSRYVKGGSIPKEWEFHRKFLSWGGSLFTRAVLWVWDVKDFTTGYKATRVKGVLEELDLNNVMSGGFAYKIDLLYKIYKMGAKITEIPIQFHYREAGEAKGGMGSFIDSLKVVLSIRMRESKSFIRFLVVGFTGAFVDFGFANLFKYSKIPSNYSASISAVIAMFTTFMLNNIWSFSDRKITGAGRLLKNLVPYLAFSSMPILFRFWLVGLVTGKIADSYLVYNLAIAFSILVGLFWNFFTYSKFIWGSEEKMRMKEKKEKMKEIESRVDSEEKTMETDKSLEEERNDAKLKDKEKDPELEKRIAEKMAEIKGKK